MDKQPTQSGLIQRVLSLGLPILFAIGLFWFVYHDFSLEDLKKSFANANFTMVLLSLLPLSFSHWLRSVRWRQLLEPLGYKPSYTHLFTAVMAGYAANLVLPRAGELLRCTLLQKSTGVPTEISIGNVVAERILDLIMLGILVLLAIAVEYDRLTAFLGGLFVSKLAVVSFNSPIFIGILIGGFLLIGLAFILIYRFRSSNVFQVIWGFIYRLISGLTSIKDVNNLPLFIMNTVFIWAGYYISSALVLYGFAPTVNLPVASALVLNVVGALAMVAPVQGGIGAYHFMVSRGLTEVYKVLDSDSLGLAFLLHTSQLIYTLIVGGICFLWLSQQTYSPQQINDKV